MVEAFVHETLPARIVFGAGGLERVPDEVAACNAGCVLVIAGGAASPVGDRLADRLGSAAAARFGRVVQHVPSDLVDAAAAMARETGADLLCSVGGGSATGLAKAVAVGLDLPIIAVPTTYAGSEATPIYGVSGERKQTARDRRALPRTVVYDPTLTTDLPADVTAASAANALAHAVAARCAPAAEPLAALHADEAIRRIVAALPIAVREPADLEARGSLLLAAYLAGSAIAATGTGLHHRLCHVIGGRHRLSHAGVHAALLPHTVAWDDRLDRDGLRRLAATLGADDAAAGLWRLGRTVGLPQGLAAVGLDADDLDGLAAEAAHQLGDTHPRAADPGWLRGLLRDAHAGGIPGGA